MKDDTTDINREQLATRIGFLLVSAGCAIGLGNIWRFPFIVGKYGGAAFVIVYLVFLLILGFSTLPFQVGDLHISITWSKVVSFTSDPRK
jgi:NSS family neurotransmitter:Na+ symporter